jgi:hypothetical protein
VIERRYVFQRVHANGDSSGSGLDVGDREKRVPKRNANRTGVGAMVLVPYQGIETINQLVEALDVFSLFVIVVIKRHDHLSRRLGRPALYPLAAFTVSPAAIGH